MHQTSQSELLAELNLTPLVDVMLVLIIMLFISIPAQNHEVSLGVHACHPLLVTEMVRLDVDFDGSISWNGLPVQNDADLEQKIQRVVQSQPQPELHLYPNKLAAYKTVLHVMATAQRLGAIKLGVHGNEQYLK